MKKLLIAPGKGNGRRLIVMLSVCFLVIATRSYCQDMLTATIANQQVHDFQRERIRSEYEQEKAELKRTTGNSHYNSSFSFTGSNRIVEQVERRIIADLKKKNPVSGKSLETALSEGHVYRNYISRFKKLGLNIDGNYADVFTAYMLGMWRIANRLWDNPSAKQILAVRRQVIDNIDIAVLSNQERQEKAAYLTYDLIFANVPFEASCKANDAIQINADADMVHSRFLQRSKMDLRKMKITERGLSTAR